MRGIIREGYMSCMGTVPPCTDVPHPLSSRGRQCHITSYGITIVISDALYHQSRQTPKFEMRPGLLEIRFYAAQDMPAYAYGPGLLAVSHGPKEFVHPDRIVECAAIYACTAATLLKPS